MTMRASDPRRKRVSIVTCSAVSVSEGECANVLRCPGVLLQTRDHRFLHANASVRSKKKACLHSLEIALFQRTRELLERYYCVVLRRGASPRTQFALHELRGRLRTIEWLHRRLIDLDTALVVEARTENPDMQKADVVKLVFTDAGRPNCNTYEQAHTPFQRSDELRVLLEAFYWSAHRVRDILRDADEAALPGIGRFESIGVRNVRNHLIEHPDAKSGVLLFGFATGGPVGPQLKPVRWSG